MPRCAPIPDPTIKAIGTASPREQGHAIIRTATPTPIALLMSPSKITHPKKDKNAITRIVGTKSNFQKKYLQKSLGGIGILPRKRLKIILKNRVLL